MTWASYCQLCSLWSSSDFEVRMSLECSEAHNYNQPQIRHISPSVLVSISSVSHTRLPLSRVEREQLFWQNYIKLVTVIFGSSWLIVSVLRPRSEEIHSLLGRVINIVRPARTGRGYFSIIVISNDNQESNTGNTDQTRQRHHHFTSSSSTGWQLKRFIFLGKYYQALVPNPNPLVPNPPRHNPNPIPTQSQPSFNPN